MPERQGRVNGGEGPRISLRSGRRSGIARGRLRADTGFTIVEIMVAAMLLMVGVLGLVAMMDGARAATGRNKLREGATNLAREAIEDVDSLPYSAIDPTTLNQTLQAKPGLANSGSGASWTVVRRGVVYTLTTAVCNVDDPRDGTGPHDASFCAGGAAAGITDPQPIDYKRVTVNANWSTATSSGYVRQTTLMFPNGASSNVPSVTNLTANTSSPVTSVNTTSISFTATTSAPPQGVEWFVNDNPMGTATGSGTTWTFNWALTNVSDGTYVVSARAFDASGTYGQPYQMTLTINRSAPAAPTNFVAGWNPRDSSVDSEWLAPPDGDVLGYHVYRQQTLPTTGAATQVNCGTAASPLYLVTKLECTDAAPIGAATSTVSEVAATAAVANSSTSITLTKPTGASAGDLLLTTIVSTPSTIVVAPSGWNLLWTSWSSTGSLQETAFWRLATSATPNSYAFTTWAQADISGTVVDYTGVDQTNPIDNFNAAGGASGSALGPATTANNANDRIVETVGFVGTGTSTWTPTAPLGMTGRALANANTNVDFSSDKSQSATGTTGTFTTVPNGTDTGWSAQTIALKPAAINFAVNYWVTAVDYDPNGNLRDGAASNVVNAYAPDNPPNAPTWQATPLVNQADGTTLLQFNTSTDPDPGDSVAFYRIYRDGQRYDRTGLGTDTTYVDPNPGGTTHTYYITAVDTHEQESTPTSSVTG